MPSEPWLAVALTVTASDALLDAATPRPRAPPSFQAYPVPDHVSPVLLESLLSRLCSLPDVTANSLAGRPPPVSLEPSAYFLSLGNAIAHVASVGIHPIPAFVVSLLGKVCTLGHSTQVLTPLLSLNIPGLFETLPDRWAGPVVLGLLQLGPRPAQLALLFGGLLERSAKVRSLLSHSLILRRPLSSNIIGSLFPYLARPNGQGPLLQKALKEIFSAWATNQTANLASYELQESLARALVFGLALLAQSCRPGLQVEFLNAASHGAALRLESANAALLRLGLAVAAHTAQTLSPEVVPSSEFDIFDGPEGQEMDKWARLGQQWLEHGDDWDGEESGSEMMSTVTCSKELVVTPLISIANSEVCNADQAPEGKVAATAHTNLDKLNMNPDKIVDSEKLDSDDEEFEAYDLSDDVRGKSGPPKPHHLRACLERLRSEDPLIAASALRAAPGLLCGEQGVAKELAVEILKSLLYLEDRGWPDSDEEEDHDRSSVSVSSSSAVQIQDRSSLPVQTSSCSKTFWDARKEAMVAAVIANPGPAAEFLSAQVFASNYNLRQRFEALDTLSTAALKLASLPGPETNRAVLESTCVTAEVKGDEGPEKWQELVRRRVENKTRYFGRQKQENATASPNRFGALASTFYFSLTRGFAGTEVAPEIWCSDGFLLGRLAATLATIALASRNTPAASLIAPDLLSFAWAMRKHPAAAARRPVFLAAVSSAAVAPPRLDWTVDVPAVASWLEEASMEESDAEARELATQGLSIWKS
uniref:telomere length regulation protein TEL2 homolog n=1 Tax=Myxine glutinosa TaxID=7769 RepID=UPI00358DEFD7